MVFHREEAEAARKAAAVMKLRGSYKVEAQKRAMAGTDVSDTQQHCIWTVVVPSRQVYVRDGEQQPSGCSNSNRVTDHGNCITADQQQVEMKRIADSVTRCCRYLKTACSCALAAVSGVEVHELQPCCLHCCWCPSCMSLFPSCCHQFTLKVPPPKRGRFTAAAQQQKAQAAALAHKKIAGKSGRV